MGQCEFIEKLRLRPFDVDTQSQNHLSGRRYCNRSHSPSAAVSSTPTSHRTFGLSGEKWNTNSMKSARWPWIANEMYICPKPCPAVCTFGLNFRLKCTLVQNCGSQSCASRYLPICYCGFRSEQAAAILVHYNKYLKNCVALSAHTLTFNSTLLAIIVMNRWLHRWFV